MQLLSCVGVFSVQCSLRNTLHSSFDTQICQLGYVRRSACTTHASKCSAIKSRPEGFYPVFYLFGRVC